MNSSCSPSNEIHQDNIIRPRLTLTQLTIVYSFALCKLWEFVRRKVQAPPRSDRTDGFSTTIPKAYGFEVATRSGGRYRGIAPPIGVRAEPRPAGLVCGRAPGFGACAPLGCWGWVISSAWR